MEISTVHLKEMWKLQVDFRKIYLLLKIIQKIVQQ